MSKALQNPIQFSSRHLGSTPAEVEEMLAYIGCDSMQELINETVPPGIRVDQPLRLPEAFTEQQLLRHMQALAEKNKVYKSYIGAGYYDTNVPSVIQRNILENPGWYTQYTPYQAEIAQGRLEALLNFQTMVTDLTGMELANASLLDEATAAAEAMTMVYNHTRKKKLGNKFIVHDNVHPQTLAVLQTRAEPFGIEIVEEDLNEAEVDDSVFGYLMQYPASNGNIGTYDEFRRAAQTIGAKAVFATDLLALALLTPPGELGADVVVGSAQRFGVPMGYGGPHAAFFATKEEYKRSIPGRLVGVSVDKNGKPALRLALQTREQHIRREKATSNICTAQVLLAIMSGMYAVYHGPNRIKAISDRVHHLTALLNKGFNELGLHQSNRYFFDTLNIHLGDNAGIKAEKLKRVSEEAGMNFRYLEDNSIGISLDETTDLGDLHDILNVFCQALELAQDSVNLGKYHDELKLNWPKQLVRQSPYLTNEVFNRYHTETKMMRYIKKLERRDLSLTQSMIPLGSCTMKLNAASELRPLSFSGFANIHPLAPANQAQGYHKMIKELGDALEEITGFAGVSFMPNSGAQGEYAGLMVIRQYLKARGEGHRNIALIPSSAHGTNPASAIMAGMKVVVVKCDDQGNVDLEDLKAKVEKHRENLAALMVTYPSTHGVFEEDIREICNLIHEAGGQVYMDGANLNAQVGITNPGIIGADVCHLNLHKTFCIPHGGGGPGMGPIGVAKHLVPHLPAHPFEDDLEDGQKMGPVSAAPYGSASILTISHAYIYMMGADGLKNASEQAILNANYIKTRLDGHYKVLFTGKTGRVAHELIIDLRPFKKSAGIEVDDLAKRLMDYGFHAPTVSWPVAGTIMVEPTESESRDELDRFCEAMIGIREEIRQIEEEKADKTNNVLKNAPHTAETVMADEWDLPYSRKTAAYPAAWTAENKFWPSVSRVNNSYGDRNLMCTCAPLEAYMEEPEPKEKSAKAAPVA